MLSSDLITILNDAFLSNSSARREFSLYFSNQGHAGLSLCRMAYSSYHSRTGLRLRVIAKCLCKIKQNLQCSLVQLMTLILGQRRAEKMARYSGAYDEIANTRASCVWRTATNSSSCSSQQHRVILICRIIIFCVNSMSSLH